MRIVDVLLAAVRYMFLFTLLIFIYFICKMMRQDLLLQKRSEGESRAGLSAFQLYVLDPGDGRNMTVDSVIPLKQVSTIGRDAANDIVINDPHVSSEHARIEIKGEKIFLIDLDSTNGTYVNGKKIRGKQQITLGDEINIGDVLFEVVGWENESSSSD